jgi:hypothetical protein
MAGLFFGRKALRSRRDCDIKLLFDPDAVLTSVFGLLRLLNEASAHMFKFRNIKYIEMFSY